MEEEYGFGYTKLIDAFENAKYYLNYIEDGSENQAEDILQTAIDKLKILSNGISYDED